MGCLLALAGLFATESASADTTGQATRTAAAGARHAGGHGPADYVAASARSATVVTSGEDQCSLPVADRTGAWVCADTADSENGTSKTTSTPPQRVGVTAATTPGGNCNSNGACWTVVDAYHARNSVGGWFGWGSTVLGNVAYSQTHSLNGSQFITKSEFDTDTAVHGLHATGDLLHGSHFDDGTPFGGDTRWYDSKSDLPRNGYWKPWADYGGFKPYANWALNHATVIEVAWEKDDYPGYWYMWMKAPVAEDPDDNNIYRFRSADYRFDNSEHIGYHS